MANATYEWEGKVKWCKVLGDARPKYDATKGNEWSTNVTITKEAKQTLKNYKILNHFKIDDEDDSQFVSIKRDELTKNGQKNKPVTVVDSTGDSWDHSKLIGNGSTVKIKVSLTPFMRDGTEHHKVTLDKVTVLDHVELPPMNGNKPNKPAPRVDKENWIDEE